MAKVKVQVTFDEDMLKELDEYCDKNHLNRSWAVNLGVTRLLNEQRVADAVPRLVVIMQKLYDDKMLDESSKKELDSITALANLIAK